MLSGINASLQNGTNPKKYLFESQEIDWFWNMLHFFESTVIPKKLAFKNSFSHINILLCIYML